MKSVQFSDWEKDRRGVSGTVDVFGPYSGGRDVNELVGDKKRHLSIQLSQKCYWKNELTSCFNLHYA